jgi:hypothetical protein
MPTVLCCYLLGWAMTAVGFAVAARKLNHRDAPAPHPMTLAVAAGAAWPLALLGAVQFAAVAVVVNAVRRRMSGPRPVTTAEFELARA